MNFKSIMVLAVGIVLMVGVCTTAFAESVCESPTAGIEISAANQDTRYVKNVGNTFELPLQIGVKYKSSNNKVASVYDGRFVKCKKVGTAYIIAEPTNGKDYHDTVYTVKVVRAWTPNTIEVYSGATTANVAFYQKADADYYKICYSTKKNGKYNEQYFYSWKTANKKTGKIYGQIKGLKKGKNYYVKVFAYESNHNKAPKYYEYPAKDKNKKVIVKKFKTKKSGKAPNPKK